MSASAASPQWPPTGAPLSWQAPQPWSFRPMAASASPAALSSTSELSSTRLANGAQAHLHASPAHQRTELNVMLPIGPSLNGARGLLPQLLLEGSQSVKQWVDAAASQGIELGVMALGDKVLVSGSAPPGREALLVDHVMTLLTQPRPDPWTFATQKEDLLKTLQKGLVMPDSRLGDAVARSLYGPNHPYGITLPELIRQVQSQNLPTVLGIYQQALGNPEQVSMLMVSPLPATQQAGLLNQAIQQRRWVADPYRRLPLPATPEVAPAVGVAPPVLMADNTLERAHLMYGWRAPNVNDPDYPAFVLLEAILNGFSGRFFDQLRTRQGLVYSTKQLYQSHQKSADFTLHLEVDFDKVNAAQQGVQTVVQDLLTRPIEATELNKVRKEYLLSLRATTQSVSGLSQLHLSHIALDDTPRLPAWMVDRIMRVTPEDVQRVAHRLFNPAAGAYQVQAIAAPESQLSQMPHTASAASLSPTPLMV